MKKYLFAPTVLTVLGVLLFYLGNEALTGSRLHEKFPALLAFFFLQSLVVAWLFDQGEKDNWKSPIYALGAVTFRFLTALFFLLILFVLEPDHIKALMIQFAGLYLVYLIFELFAVLPNLRRN